MSYAATTHTDPITAFDAATAAAHIVTETTTASHSRRTASTTPARKDRRKDHPAPLTETDRAALAAMPYITDAGDLCQLPPRYRSRALAFLRAFADGAKTRDAMIKTSFQSWELSYCRTNSQTFRTVHEMIITAKREAATAEIEETLVALATGNFKPKKDCLPPETRAASVILPAFDNRYRNSGGTAQQVQINISI